MTPANRQAAAKERGSLDTWLRQKFGKVKAPKRNTLLPPAHVKQKNWGANRGHSHGSPPKLDALKDWRDLMWKMKLMASYRPEYKQKIKEACQQYDTVILGGSEQAKRRQAASRGRKHSQRRMVS